MPHTESLYRRAADIILSGGLVILPTETFYALAANPFHDEALRRIFDVKRRIQTKPLPLIASDKAAVKKVVCRMSPLTRKLTDRFWPGSLTVLLEPCHQVSALLTGPSGKIGVRVPPECAARIVAAAAGGWVTATSANLSDEIAPDEVSKIAEEVLGAVDLVLDLGPTPGGKPSTVVEPLDGDFRVLREGAVPEPTLRRHCMHI